MRFRNILIFLGFLVLVLEFLGFPRAWDDAFYALLGILVMAFAYLSGKKAGEAALESPVEASAPTADVTTNAPQA